MPYHLRGLGTAMVAAGQPDNGYGFPPGCMESGDPISDITPCGFKGPSTPAQLALIQAMYGPPPSYVPAQFQIPVWVNGQVQAWFGGDASGGNPYAPEPGSEAASYGAPAGTVNQTYTPPAAETAAIAATAAPAVAALSPPASGASPSSSSSVITTNAVTSAPSGTVASTDWFTEDSYGSIPNWWWVAGAAAVGVFFMMRGKG